MTHLEIIKSRIFDLSTLHRKVNIWKFQGKKIVWTNGCFDLLHLGHIDYLSKAADLGDILLVGLNTDNSVSRIKGPKRPINNEISRATVLASLHFIDGIILFNEETPYELIKYVEPDVLVKGSDYKPEEIVGFDVVQKKGGIVQTIDFLPGYSTSLIEKKILSQGSDNQI